MSVEILLNVGKLEKEISSNFSFFLEINFILFKHWSDLFLFVKFNLNNYYARFY